MLFNIDAAARDHVSGWVSAGADAAPLTLEVVLDGIVAGQVVADLPHSSHPPNGLGRRSCGFRVGDAHGFELSGAGEIEIRVGSTPIYRARRAAGLARERLFLMHIPKTGGTSLNHVVKPLFESSYEHVESQDVDTARSILGLSHPRSLFLSGHVLFHDITATLLQVPTRLTTVLRDPIDHLISHVAWIYRVSMDPAQIDHHPPEIIATGRRIAEIDLDDEGSVGQWVRDFGPMEAKLFFNLQTRFLGCGDTSRPATADDLGLAVETLARFDAVGRIERIDLFGRRLGRLIGVDLGPIPHLRTNPDTLQFRKLARYQRLLRPLLELDEVLVAQVKRSESLASRVVSGWRSATGALMPAFGKTPSRRSA